MNILQVLGVNFLKVYYSLKKYTKKTINLNLCYINNIHYYGTK